MREPHNLRTLLEARARARPSRVMVVTPEREVRYAEFNALVDRMAGALHRLGVRQGDRVVCTLPNGLDMLGVFFAVAKLGAANVFVNPDYDAALFQKVAASVQPKALILDETNMAKIRGTTFEGLRIHWPAGAPLQERETAFDEILSGDASDLPSLTIAPGDAVQYVFTSGTTGLPKACVLSHRARLSLSEHVVRLLHATDEDRFFGCLPNYHGNLWFAIFGALVCGGSVAIAERFSAGRYWELVRRLQATLLVLHGVPLNILLKAPASEDDTGQTARALLTVGGDYATFLTRFGLNTAVLGYGATEVGLTSLGVVSRWAAADTPASFTGTVRNDHEVRIVREDGSTANTGENGEIHVRAREPHTIFSGYHVDGGVRPPNDDGWYRTRDRGSIDTKGALHFYGRIGDSVRVKGEFVPVEYLESLVRTHPAVEDCAVLGVPSPLGEQDLALFVQAKAGSELDADSVTAFLKPRVPRFMLPEKVTVVAQFPRAAATLKIQKSKLLEGA